MNEDKNPLDDMPDNGPTQTPEEQADDLQPETVQPEKTEIVHEPQPAPQQVIPQPATPQTEVPAAKKKKGPARKIILFLLLAVAAYLIYSVADIYVSPDKNIQQIYLVPEDAAFIIQSSDPVNDWTKFSKSDTWKALKKAEPVQEIAATAEMLDSIVQSNKTLLSLVGKRDMLISVHKTRPNDFDFLIILDLQKAAKLNVVKDQIETIVKMTGSTVTRRTHSKIDILEIKDPETREIMYLSFIDNHVALSFTSKLVEAAIDGRHTPKIGLDYYFLEVDKMVAGKGLFRMFVNNKRLPEFMSLFLDEPSEYMDMFSTSMGFSGLHFDTNNDRIELKGYTVRKDTADPYITALLSSGKHKMKAHEIMSARTAVFTHIGIDNPVKFVKQLETAMQASDPKEYESFAGTRKKIESLFGISLEDNFLSWMSGEFAVSQSEPGLLLGPEPEMILAIGAKNMKDARKNMEFIEKKIKNRTPIKIKSVEYKDYEINYVELKGFFRLFFGKMFDKFEKPFYTYVDDYVLFSNKPSTLLSFIEDYEQKNLLKDNETFKKAYSQFKNTSTFFFYTDMQKFFPQLKPMLNAETWADVNKNKDVLYSFPSWGIQIVGEEQSAALQYIMNYKPYDPEAEAKAKADALAIEEEEEEADPDEEVTEKQEMDELKRFYIEKFQGNVMREFYEDGTLKSETEIKDGKRHGRHREYYGNGKLKVRGKYSANRPKGTWKYYSEEGKLSNKEKF